MPTQVPRNALPISLGVRLLSSGPDDRVPIDGGTHDHVPSRSAAARVESGTLSADGLPERVLGLALPAFPVPDDEFDRVDVAPQRQQGREFCLQRSPASAG